LIKRLLFVYLAFFHIFADGIPNKLEDNSMSSEYNSPLSNGDVTIITVFDNYLVAPTLTKSWGFGCIIRIKNRSILFDTGDSVPIFLSNMKKLGVNPKEIDIVALSHIHGDHTGGLDAVLQANPNVTVYIPVSFSSSIRNRIASYGAKNRDIDSPLQISDDVYTTGEMGTGIREQALILDLGKQTALITGCAHPGIVDMANRAKEVLPNKKLLLVMGGFHLLSASHGELRRIAGQLKALGVERIAPSHCSGDRCREVFKEEFRDNYISGGAGRVIEIPLSS
jgi:7,8-dihydropterin-6-yl-methyl-4-(beta-D-ribofuranosyl)aminobenzene 5'-phosphate synthase